MVETIQATIVCVDGIRLCVDAIEPGLDTWLLISGVEMAKNMPAFNEAMSDMMLSGSGALVFTPTDAGVKVERVAPGDYYWRPR